MFIGPWAIDYLDWGFFLCLRLPFELVEGAVYYRSIDALVSPVTGILSLLSPTSCVSSRPILETSTVDRLLCFDDRSVMGVLVILRCWTYVVDLLRDRFWAVMKIEWYMSWLRGRSSSRDFEQLGSRQKTLTVRKSFTNWKQTSWRQQTDNGVKLPNRVTEYASVTLDWLALSITLRLSVYVQWWLNGRSWPLKAEDHSFSINWTSTLCLSAETVPFLDEFLFHSKSPSVESVL